MPIAPDNLPDDPAALKRIIAAMAQDGLTAQAEIARLKFQLARYRRAEFGRSSEKLARDTEQLELALETLETDQAERLATASPAVAAVVQAEAQKPARRPLPEYLPREDLRHPAACTCPSCGGALRKISDEVTETLDYVPGRFTIRTKPCYEASIGRSAVDAKAAVRIAADGAQRPVLLSSRSSSRPCTTLAM